jgi:20S proteasome alpha/beta subunit
MISIAFLTALMCILNICSAAENRIDGRYSFSLTTFDPNGKLNQVERASRAAFLGTPVVAICRPNIILLAAPQSLPSPLVEDDGTARFVKVSTDIVVAHTGVAADGRIAIAAGQRLAVEHEFTFDETIPVQVFLEAMALLFQEYTMKAGARPFGCALLVGSLETGELYRMDPSGSVETLGSCGVVGSLTEKLHSKVENLSKMASDDAELMASLTTLLCEAMRDEHRGNKEIVNKEPPIISAMFTNNKLFVDCVDQQAL